MIKYENLIEDPDYIQEILMRKMPFLVKRKPFSEFYVDNTIRDGIRALGGIRPIDKNNVAKWKNHLPRIADQVSKYGDITKELIEYGYEKDNSWLEHIGDQLDSKIIDRTGEVSKIRWKKYYFSHPMTSVIALICYKSGINFG